LSFFRYWDMQPGVPTVTWLRNEIQVGMGSKNQKRPTLL
jgi:hypothetical protein